MKIKLILTSLALAALIVCAGYALSGNSAAAAMVDDKGFLKNELSDDGLHPNAEGYVVMAPLAEAAIAASLKRRK